ncbi:glycoside hydrolase [Bosea sp. LjRoot90]|uniref:glycoside hydrolase n=1 Tax=Bosea sp. LjRoot90 TaxID=3342342 RepID=UPI003ECDACCC
MDSESDFLAAMIGRSYEAAGLHCWELTRQCQREIFGRELPAVLTAPDSKRELVRLMAERDRHAGWREVGRPAHGAVVFLTRKGHGVSRAACHAGTFLALDGGGVLHTDAPHGVVFESLLELKARNWAEPSFYLPR